MTSNNGYETSEQASERRLWAMIFAVLVTATVLWIGSTFVWEERTQPDVPLPVATEPHGFANHEAEPQLAGWSKARADHLKLHPACEVCGEREAVEVHHYEPQHLHPEKALDPNNLVTLCRRDHLYFGHLGDFKCENRDLRKWIKAIKDRKEE